MASLGRPDAVFYSPETGRVAIWGIGGNSVSPYSDPPTRMNLFLENARDAGVFRRLILRHATIAKATINDAGDGEYYELHGVTVTGHSTSLYGTTHPGITIHIAVFHMKCGPPTCLTPQSD
jgi:hypothetical protein